MAPRWTEERKDELRRLWVEERGSFSRIAQRMGVTRGTIDGASRRLRLQVPPGKPRVLAADHPAVVVGRTVFPEKWEWPIEASVLKSGDNTRKLGGAVAKGHWRGMPIFMLTLEERATCPRDCALWRSCYGNRMRNAVRYAHGDALENRLAAELAKLQRLFPFGFVVRLHLLGDFYSVGYVDFWAGALTAFPALRVFGYTAWQRGTPIGDRVADLRDRCWDRFAVRTSGASDGPRTVVIEHGDDPSPAIACPAQTGRTASCSSCALCWGSRRPIAFERH